MIVDIVQQDDFFDLLMKYREIPSGDSWYGGHDAHLEVSETCFMIGKKNFLAWNKHAGWYVHNAWLGSLISYSLRRKSDRRFLADNDSDQRSSHVHPHWRAYFLTGHGTIEPGYPDYRPQW